jgi:hypothetical protein
MKLKVVTIALLIGAQPAWACHRFSKWYYPTPQKCYTASVPTKYKYYVEIIKTPPMKINWPPFVFIRSAWEMNTMDWDINKEMKIEELKRRMK